VVGASGRGNGSKIQGVGSSDWSTWLDQVQFVGSNGQIRKGQASHGFHEMGRHPDKRDRRLTTCLEEGRGLLPMPYCLHSPLYSRFTKLGPSRCVSSWSPS
jgi:hypothetical protein